MCAFNKTTSRSGLHLITGLSLIIGLAACSGGGSSSSSGGITLPTAPVTITPANASQVFGAAIDTVYGGINLPIGVQTSVSASTTSAASAAQKVARIGQSAAQQIVSQSAATATVTGAVTTTSCLFGGTISVTATSSTSGSATYTNCSQISGETINGTLTLNNIFSNPSTYLTADVVFNLTVTTASPANTLTAKGDMSLFINNVTYAITMSGTSLAMGNTDSTLGNFGLQSYLIAINGAGATTAMAFTFSGSRINGTAVFTMANQLVPTTGMFPNSGSATIAGAHSTVLKITILGDENATGNQIQLELSIDGGNNYAPPTFDTWANISSRI